MLDDFFARPGTGPDVLLPKPRRSLEIRRAFEALTMLKFYTLFATSLLLAMLASGSSVLAQSSDNRGANMRALGERNAAPLKAG